MKECKAKLNQYCPKFSLTKAEVWVISLWDKESQLYLIFKWVALSKYVSSSMRKMHIFRFIPRMRKVSSGHLYILWCLIILLANSKGPVQNTGCTSWSGLSLPQMPEDAFSFDAAQIIVYRYVHFLPSGFAGLLKWSRCKMKYWNTT